MNKKWLIIPAGILTAITLSSCGSKTVATTDGGKITEAQYYSSMKQTTQGKQVLQQMILNKVLEKKYGNKVTNAQVNKRYNQFKKQYGDNFSTALQQENLTPNSFKKQIRSNLLLKEAVKNDVKITNADLKKQFKTWEPKVQTAIIMTKNENKAQQAINDLNNGQNFADVAKKYSQDSNTKNKGGKLPKFDNSSSLVPTPIKKAAFKLNNGQYTKTPIKSSNSGVTAYYIIKMINKPNKGTWQQHKNALREQILDQDMNVNNSSVLQKVVSEELKDGHVSIKDKDLKNILAAYTTNN